MAKSLALFLAFPTDICIGAHDDLCDENGRSGSMIDAQQGRNRIERANRCRYALAESGEAHGLTCAGHRVAALKLTGTGAYGDWNAYADAGAPHVADLVDAGFASTCGVDTDRILSSFDALRADAIEAACDVILVAPADGVQQAETAALLGDLVFRDACGGFVFAAPDELSAFRGVDWLARRAIAPLAVSGALALSPLAISEALEATGHDVLPRSALCVPSVASALLANTSGVSTVSNRLAMEKVSSACKPADTEPPSTFWSACRDGGRRPTVSATGAGYPYLPHLPRAMLSRRCGTEPLGRGMQTTAAGQGNTEPASVAVAG